MSDNLKTQVQDLEAEVAVLKSLVAAQSRAPSAPTYNALDDVAELRREITSLKSALAASERNAAETAGTAANHAVASGQRSVAKLMAEGMAHVSDDLIRETQKEFDKRDREIDIAKRQADRFENAVLDGAKISAGFILAVARKELEA